MTASMTPARVRKIRKALGFSQEDFARTLWVTYTTINRWEAGRAAPSGMHLRILLLLEQSLNRPSFRAVLRDPRASDPMFLLHRLLEPLYGEIAPRKTWR
jgi:transcriptional regulator with XRE-family HTH domain